MSDKYTTYYYKTNNEKFLIAVPGLLEADMRIVSAAKHPGLSFDLTSTLRPDEEKELKKFAKSEGFKVNTKTCAVTFEYA